MDFKVYLISIFLLFFVHLPSVAATRVSQANGNWNNAATWGGVLPVANDDIIISAGTIVYLNASLPDNSSFNSLVINEGGSLVVGSNGVMLRLKGSLVNNGLLDLWKSPIYQADLWLYGGADWSGSGSWNLSDVNFQSFSVDLSAGLTITINGSITAYAGSSFNKNHQYRDITLNIRGELNSMIPSSSDFYYGNLVINKTANTVSFSPSTSPNLINLLGDLTVVSSTDRLIVTINNTLSIKAGVTGAGVISGSTTSSLVIDNPDEPAINPLRILSGTFFKEFIVNRKAGVTLVSGFVVRESLQLNNFCILTLPPQNLTLGVNGTNPTAGRFSGDGSFIASTGSGLTIRGKDTAAVVFRFDQGSVANYTLNSLIIDRRAGKVGLDVGGLLITGKLDIADKNLFSLGAGKLMINTAPNFTGSGCLSGSKSAELSIGGTGTVGYSLSFDQLTPFGNTLKSYSQSRNAVTILANNLDIVERVSLTGSSAVLVSEGHLTLLSSADGTAGISPLLNNADVRGDINVQVYLSGDNQSMKFRGYRALSSPLNDNQIEAGKKKSLEQLKDYIIITGPGGTANGFDQGGMAQPFAETLTLYNPLFIPGSSAFTPIKSIFDPLVSGAGFMTFYRGRQQGSYSLNSNKLNSPYRAPESATIIYKGPINKRDVPGVILHSDNDTTNSHRGYNLIGNPYPSAIDWTKVTKSAGVNDEVIILKPGGGTATYLNGISNNGGSPIVQTGQGFYVRTNSDGNTVSFTEECKTDLTPATVLLNAADRQTAGRRSSQRISDWKPTDRSIIKLSLCNESEADETTIVFETGQFASANFDDAMYFSGSSVNLASFSVNGKKLAINFMPDLLYTEEVRLSVNALNGGSYSLNFARVPDRPVTMFLKDAYYNNQLTQIDENDSYCFSIDKKDPMTFGDNRFSLVFDSGIRPTADAEDKGLKLIAYPNPVLDKLFIAMDTIATTSAHVLIFDMKGERKYKSEFHLTGDRAIDVSWLSPGIYIARLRTADKGKSLGEIVFIKQ